MNIKAVWNDSLATGYSVVDDQHKDIIDKVNTLYDMIIHQEDTVVLNNKLRDIIAETLEHFKSEEHYLGIIKYPDIVDHLEEHDRIEDSLFNLLKDYENTTNTFIKEQIIVHIKVALVNHMNVDDMKFSTYVRALPK